MQSDMSGNHQWIEGGPPGDKPGDGTNAQGPDSGEMRDAAGQVLAGRFEVHEEIGAGAFAVTYRGRDRRLGRSVAIKVLRHTYATSPSFVLSVEREARAAALVTHGNVVDVYDFGQHGELLYMVMQYIEGEDLKHLIARAGPVPERRAVQIALQMLAGLAAIHQAGIIHRDIKPQNVMIGRDGIARVTDFGIARVTVDVGLTTTGTTVGTASYMAPEQAQAGTLAEATDLYSVGVVLYEMLTARLPFEAPTTIALMLAHIQTRPVPPSGRAPEQRISPELDAVVMRALAKRPEDRFANAPAMARALTAAIGDDPAVTEATRPIMTVAPDTVRTVRTVAPSSTRRGDALAAVPEVAKPRSRARRGLWVLPLLLLLLAGGMGGAALFREFGDGGGDDDRPRQLVANLGLTPTAGEEEAVETPAGQPVSTDTPEPAPTDPPAPTSTPTRTPEPTPTEAPPPTRARPTETPVPPPTRTPEPVPTDPPADIASGADPDSGDEAEEAIITRRDEADEAGGEEATEAGAGGEVEETIIASGNGTDDPEETGDGEAADQDEAADAAEDTTTEGQAESGTMTMSFAASVWQGAYFQETGNLRPWSALYAQSTGYGSGSLSFSLDGEPASDTFTLTVDGMTSENWTELPIAILINGQQVYSGNSPFPTWNGVDGEQPWRTVIIELPASVLRQGENTLTFVNLREEGEFSRPPYILLADGTMTIEILQPGAVQPSYGDTSPVRQIAIATVAGNR